MKVSLTPHQQKFIAKKMRNGGYLSRGEVVREALRAYELTELQDSSPELEAVLRHSLRSPRKNIFPATLPHWLHATDAGKSLRDED